MNKICVQRKGPFTLEDKLGGVSCCPSKISDLLVFLSPEHKVGFIFHN